MVHIEHAGRVFPGQQAAVTEDGVRGRSSVRRGGERVGSSQALTQAVWGSTETGAPDAVGVHHVRRHLERTINAIPSDLQNMASIAIPSTHPIAPSPEPMCSPPPPAHVRQSRRKTVTPAEYIYIPSMERACTPRRSTDLS